MFLLCISLLFLVSSSIMVCFESNDLSISIFSYNYECLILINIPFSSCLTRFCQFLCRLVSKAPYALAKTSDGMEASVEGKSQIS